MTHRVVLVEAKDRFETCKGRIDRFESIFSHQTWVLGKKP